MAVNAKNWQEMKKPNALEKKATTDARRKATFVAEPLERGFGLTLGNSLRRCSCRRCRVPPSPRSRSRACCTNSPRSPACARTSPTSSST
jgi:hypothetical protein